MSIRDFVLGIAFGYVATALLFLIVLIQPMENELKACKVKHNVHKCNRVYVPPSSSRWLFK